MEKEEIWPEWQYRKCTRLFNELRFREVKIRAPDTEKFKVTAEGGSKDLKISFRKAKIQSGL